MVAININLSPLLYSFRFINNSGNQGICSRVGYNPSESLGKPGNRQLIKRREVEI
jgi:hypothetical protein